MYNVPGRKNIYCFKVNLNMYYKMSCVHDEHGLGYGYDDAGDELLAKDVVRRQQWWLLPVPDVLRILRRLAGVYVRMDQQADIMACWLVYIYMAFILTARAFSSGLCHGLTGRVGNGVLQVDVYRPCCVRFLSPSSSRWPTFFQCCFTNRELNGSNHLPDSNIALFLDSFDVKGCANNSFKTSASVLKPCVKLCSKRS